MQGFVLQRVGIDAVMKARILPWELSFHACNVTPISCLSSCPLHNAVIEFGCLFVLLHFLHYTQWTNMT